MRAIFSSKTIITIQSWQEDDLKSFELWLKSPWCNTNKNLIPLFECLKKYYPNFENPKLTKERLFAQVLPNGKFSVRRVNNLLSELYLAAERFMIFQNVAKNQRLQNNLLSQELQNRGLENWFFKNIEKEISRLEAKPIKDWEDHLALLMLHRRVYHHPNENLQWDPGSQTIIKLDEQVDIVYLLEKATIINEKIFRNRILKNENHNISEALNKWMLASKGIKHPAIEFYKMRFEYSEENIFEKYTALRNRFLKEYDQLNEKEQKVHYISLLNDSTFLVKRGNLHITEILPIYELGLETELILHEGKLTYPRYTTIVTISNSCKNYSFTEQFIEKYTEKVDELFREDAYYWAKAHTAYRRRQFSDCLDILQANHFKVPYFQTTTKVLTTQVFFDLYIEDDSYQSLLFNYFDSFEKWLLREKMFSKNNKKSILKFVQRSRSLAKYYNDSSIERKKVEALLKNEKNIQALNWLKLKAKEIIELKEKKPF